MKSVTAVLAGLVATIVLSIGADLAMYSSHLFPKTADMTDMHWSIATAYRAVFAILGCWLAARLAPAHPMKHALIAGGIGMLLAVIGAVFTWNKGPEMGPHWYAVALIVTALPCAWLGGRWGKT